MADILAIVGILVLVGGAQAGLVITFCLLFPTRVEAASARLEQHPWRSLLLGSGAAVALALPVIVLLRCRPGWPSSSAGRLWSERLRFPASVPPG